MTIKHTIINLDDVAEENFSINHPTPLDNGRLVAFDTLAVDGEAYVSKTPTDVINEPVYFHCSVEMMYDERKVSLEEFYLEVGKKGRVKPLNFGDRVQITTDGIDATETAIKAVKENDYLVPANGKEKFVILKATDYAKLTAETKPSLILKVDSVNETLGMNQYKAFLLRRVK